MFCQYTEAAAKDFAQLRMNPILNEYEPVSALMLVWGKGGRSIRGYTRNEGKILFGTGAWIQCKPANMSSMRGHVADEVEEYAARVLANAIARTSLFPNKKIVVCSTPLYEGDAEPGNEFVSLYKAGRQEEWNMCCLACGGLIPTRFRDCVKWDNDKAQRNELE